MIDFKVEGKPHLSLSSGFWGVRWPELVDSDSNPVKEVALWIAMMNHPLVKNKILCNDSYSIFGEKRP